MNVASLIRDFAYKQYPRAWWLPAVHAMLKATNSLDLVPNYLVTKWVRAGQWVRAGRAFATRCGGPHELFFDLLILCCCIIHFYVHIAVVLARPRLALTGTCDRWRWKEPADPRIACSKVESGTELLFLWMFYSFLSKNIIFNEVSIFLHLQIGFSGMLIFSQWSL